MPRWSGGPMGRSDSNSCSFCNRNNWGQPHTPIHDRQWIGVPCMQGVWKLRLFWRLTGHVCSPGLFDEPPWSWQAGPCTFAWAKAWNSSAVSSVRWFSLVEELYHCIYIQILNRFYWCREHQYDSSWADWIEMWILILMTFVFRFVQSVDVSL